jgi:hypothetical protein
MCIRSDTVSQRGGAALVAGVFEGRLTRTDESGSIVGKLHHNRKELLCVSRSVSYADKYLQQRASSH